MQFIAAQKRAIAAGKLTRSYRNWKTRQVKPGGRYPIHPLGFIRVNALDEVLLSSITEADARKAGAQSLQELTTRLSRNGVTPKTVFVVSFEFDGQDNPNAPTTDTIDEQTTHNLCKKINDMEQRSKSGPWVWATLRLIADNPERRAADLAPQVNMQRDDFKLRVRRLKKLGLTHSLETGYRISQQGAACLTAPRDRQS